MSPSRALSCTRHLPWCRLADCPRVVTGLTRIAAARFHLTAVRPSLISRVRKYSWPRCARERLNGAVALQNSRALTIPSTAPRHATPAIIKLLVADDRLVVREGLKRLVAQCSDMRVVGEAATRDEVLEQARTTEADVLLLDLFLGTPTNLGLIRDVNRRHPRCRVLDKLQLRSNAAIIRYAIEHHLVASPSAAPSQRRKSTTDPTPGL